VVIDVACRGRSAYPDAAVVINIAARSRGANPDSTMVIHVADQGHVLSSDDVPDTRYPMVDRSRRCEKRPNDMRVRDPGPLGKSSPQLGGTRRAEIIGG
jgi:hypothetical protein